MNLNAPSPQPYRTNQQALEHSDGLVHRAQRYIDKHSRDDSIIAGLSDDLFISERQLNRRFIKALKFSPLLYL